MSAGHAATVQNHRNLLSFLYIGGACNDLNRLCLSDINLAYYQLIRVRVLLNLYDLTNDDIFQICIQSGEALHLRSGKCHCICIFLRRYIQIRHIRFNP